MKSERKQIQESNLLADKIETQVIKFKKALPAIIAGIVALVVAMLGYGFYSSIQETEAARSWTALYFSDTDTSDLNAISTDFGGSKAALWARQTAGDAYMSRALENVYLERDLADDDFKKAVEEYKAVSEKTTDAFLKERSLYGLAQASEGLGNREEALAFYRKVAVTQGLSPEFLMEVNKRATWLESKAGDEFYTWYKENRPSAPALQNSSPNKLPLPGAPDIKFPNLPDGSSPANATPTVPADNPNSPTTSPDSSTIKPDESVPSESSPKP